MRIIKYIKIRSCLIAILPAIMLLGCTGLKHVSSNDPLFVDHELKYIAEYPVEKKSLPDLNNVLLPKPNEKFLWMRPALARNNMLSDSAKTKKFWKNKVSEPVIVSLVKPNQIVRAISNRMFHSGYFHNSVDFDTIRIGNKRAKLQYNITLKEPYRIGTINFPDPHDSLNVTIVETRENSLLVPGDIYSLNTIKDERMRINRYLEENGFIYFNPEFIIFKADSITEKNKINIQILVKPDTPPESRRPYSIGKIFIHDDHGLENYEPDTLNFNPYYLITQKNRIKFSALERGLFLEPGKLYSRSDHIQTIRYLSNLPIIRYASIKFSESNEPDKLNTLMYLNQRKRNAYSAEVNAIFRSTNYFGPGILFSYTDRNAGGGAEQLKLNLKGRLEVQIADGGVNPAYELGVELNYIVPKLYPPFLDKQQKPGLPRTQITAGYNLFNRLDLYRLNSLYTDVGYKWSKNDVINHTFNPLEIVFVLIPEESQSDEFKDYLEENPGVKRSFEEQFIIGIGYGFTYDPRPKDRSEFYFRGKLDLSGNILNAFYSATDAETDSVGRYTLFGVPFSQYARISTDLRYSYKLSKNSSLAIRFFTGLGIPYGNSDIVPYIKQFYVGGTNSLRSFIARSVGPGAELPPEGFNDLTGDIRLEWNLEYRFTISGNFKGALFTDMGNVWLYNEDPTRPDGNFQFDTFLNETAVSSGFGMRWDFEFVVARLDFAYTLRTPYLPEGERWADRIDIWNPTLNIAIGYPF
jgi:outer membrane protein assembly factor BamA